SPAASATGGLRPLPSRRPPPATARLRQPQPQMSQEKRGGQAMTKLRAWVFSVSECRLSAYALAKLRADVRPDGSSMFAETPTNACCLLCGIPRYCSAIAVGMVRIGVPAGLNVRCRKGRDTVAAATADTGRAPSPERQSAQQHATASAG